MSSVEVESTYRSPSACAMIGDALAIGLSRNAKRGLAMVVDVVLLALAMWAAFALRFSEWWPSPINDLWWLVVAAPLVALPAFHGLHVYRAVIRYISNRAFVAIGLAVTLHVAVMVSAVWMLVGFDGIPRSVFIIYWLVGLLLIIGSRVLVRNLFEWSEGLKRPHTPVVIYGAGRAGAELARSLRADGAFTPTAFIDEKRALQQSEVQGLRVFAFDDLRALIDRYGVTQLLLAIPAASRGRRRQVLQRLERLSVQVRTVPGLMDLVSGKSVIEDLQEVDVEDLLGREPVPPNDALLSACINGKSVMITGAGGSIGSELARQVLRQVPSRLVLFEASEFALYEIERELRGYAVNVEDLEGIDIVPILGSVTDRHTLASVLRSCEVQTVYHAAAYKHVPLVEHNPIEGVKNNVFGTWYTASAARAANVEAFILISTDKAVRPTNVMGAAKRIAELTVQGLAQDSQCTAFSIVRFGNVLGSSGSVVPLFRQQIRRGGPITVTHRAIIRYFMTTAEAVQLVIQAGSMGRNGEVFVLDMGEPVRIADMARRMISLSGLNVRDNDSPDGDIEVKFTGLRPGEKLYEETLLGDNVTSTEHPRIMRAREADLPLTGVRTILRHLRVACAKRDNDGIRRLLKDAVAEYVPQGPPATVTRGESASRQKEAAVLTMRGGFS